MSRGGKIALGIGIPLATAIVYFVLRNKAKNKGCAKSEFGATIYGVPPCKK
jgi:hypothetical protein